jgi:hypothetical protein
MYDEKQMILFSTFVICFQLKNTWKYGRNSTWLHPFLKGKMLVKLIVNFKTIKWFENNQGNNDIL